MSQITIACLLWLVSSAPVIAAQLRVSRVEARNVSLNLRLDERDFDLAATPDGAQEFQFGESRNFHKVGEPALPRYYRLVALTPGQSVAAQVTRIGARTQSNVNIKLAAADPLEGSPEEKPSPVPLVQQEGVILRDAGRIGPARLYSVEITGAKLMDDTLTMWREIRVDLSISGEAQPLILTPFQRKMLVLGTVNGQMLANAVGVAPANTYNLIVTTTAYEAAADALAALFAPRDLRYQKLIIDSGVKSSTEVKAAIQEAYNGGSLNQVVILGDESIVPLHSWSSVPGDFYYSLLSGSDNYGDVGVGRLPISNQAEFELLTAKYARYLELQQSGFSNNNVMLVAHKENYPGKYTANMERVRTAPNPLGLMFNTQYGGAGASNASVIDNVQSGFGVVIYRGHGSNTSWSGWDTNSSSFGATQLEQMQNVEPGFGVFLNITCNNGAVQQSSHSQVENMLFLEPVGGLHRGAVAALGATIPSATYTNHDFIEHIFKHWQDTSAATSLGETIGYANMMLVRNNGGSLLDNVKMYILFSEPNLTPLMAPEN